MFCSAVLSMAYTDQARVAGHRLQLLVAEHVLFLEITGAGGYDSFAGARGLIASSLQNSMIDLHSESISDTNSNP